MFVGAGREIHLTKDLAIAKIVRVGTVEWEFAPPPRLMWPLVAGRSGSGTGTVRYPQNPAGVPVTYFWSVETVEEIRVPAGTFKAFRIGLRMLPKGGTGGPPPPSLRFWYAPDAQQIVKAEVLGVLAGAMAFQVVAVLRPGPPPLQIAVDEPKDQARVPAEAATLSGKVTAGKGVARVAVSLNGQEIATQDEAVAPKPEVALNLPLKLKEGRNVLLVTAADAAGVTRQEARVLFFEKPATTPPPPPVIGARPAPAPLIVSIAEPKDQAKLDQASIALAAMVSGGTGISRVIVTLNGTEVTRREEKAPPRALPLNLPVTLREGRNTLVVTATDAAGAITQEVRTVQHEKLVPLTVDVRYPEDRARVAEEASVVAALITSSKGVAEVRITLNGAEVLRQGEGGAQRSLAATASVMLREGANAIVITAREADGAVRQEIRTVFYERAKVAAPAPPPPPPAVGLNRWAVVIGVGRYENKAIPRLGYTVADAEAIYQTLIGPGGFKKENVLLMTDKTERKPTLRNLKWALGTFLSRSAKKEDLVLIFFAGHGAPEVDQRGVERDGLAKYLIPADADPDDLYSTALPMDELQTIFGRIEAERVVAFLDACYSGAAGGRTFASLKTRASNLDDLFLERLTRAKGRAIITASRPAEVSIELQELGHGLFTYYLLQGLRGAADTNRDGIVSLQELYEYVEQQVTQKAKAVGGRQNPVMKGELEGVLPLVKVGR